MTSKGMNDKSIHCALISHENDKLKELLLELKFVLKDVGADTEKTERLKIEYGFEYSDVKAILSHEDVKVRQFGAFCIADLFGESAATFLVDAYLREDVEYNKEHLVKALTQLPLSSGQEKLYGRLEELIGLLRGEKNESHKHYIKEIRSLLCLLRKDGERRPFTGQKLKNEIVLTTNRNFREVTLDSIKGCPKKLFNAGVMVLCDDIRKIADIRTFDEMLFAPPFDEENYGLIGKEKDVARRYISEVLTPYILERMKIRKNAKKLPVSFRLDIKGEEVRETEEDIQRTLTGIVEEESGYELINIRNDFDIQIRFVKRKTGVFRPLVKFYVPKDARFLYKTTDVAAGLKPYTAALICALCGEYMTEGAKVLDPFCGAGTLLVERDKFLKTEFLFGSDIYPAACAAAEQNLAKAGLSVKSKIINKDFLSLGHKELFTELITDLPFETEKKTLKELEAVYSAFFSRCTVLLEKGSYIFVYTRNYSLLKKEITRNNVGIVKCFEISKREGAYLCVLKI